MPCLEVVEGNKRGRVFVLDRVRSYVIGRLPLAEIHIDDHGVSRRHVRLTRRADGSIEAADMRSTNGLFVNGERHERVVLDDGDLLSLGPDAALRLRWRIPPDPDAEPSTPSERSAVERVAAEPTAEEPVGVTGLAAGPGPIQVAEAESERTLPGRPRVLEQPLSARQLEVARLVAQGLTNAAIGEQLGISTRTVTTHLDHIYSRLSINSRAALTHWLIDLGLAPPPPE